MNRTSGQMPHHRFRCLMNGLSRVIVSVLFRIRYEGLEHVPPSGPAILVANHTSLMDMFAIHVRVIPWIHWVAKKELFRHPLLRAILERLGCIPVNRGKADLSAARGIIGALRQGQVVGMFPQGTRVRPDQISMVKPRSGAVHFAQKTGSPLLPVAVDGRFGLFRTVRIVYGPPFHLDFPQGAAIDAEQAALCSCQIMQRVYSLIGRHHVYDCGTQTGEEQA